MRRFPALRAVFAILGVALACAAATLALPTNPYQRYQLLHDTIHSRARWIYERIHFDPTPIDVVIIGSSRTGAGANARRLGQLTGLNVVNFSLPEAGRNINHAIIAELLTRKSPRLIVLGVTEKPSRLGHSTYRYLAPTMALLDPAYVGNINYIPDLGSLPFRQLQLFAATLAPDVMGLSSHFDSALYAGAVYNTTADIVLPDGRIKRTDVPADPAELARGVAKFERGMQPPILPASFADIEFGDERIYVRRIAALARARGIRVAFLAMPYYTGPVTVQEDALYRSIGPVWNAGFVHRRADLYSDYGHLTRTGALVVSDWLAPRIAALLAEKPAVPATADR